mmetsp:Transcript_10421/g.31867  ORF Transcript_10421/g.31867 Transcript_10421/m.31867 type:complete len:81 (-) Transcript_10421:111-353(-)
MDVKKVNENEMKSPEGKKRWRTFLESVLKPAVNDDYNFGTLLRTDTRGKYEEDNTILVLRGQFYAVEIARNRESCNDGLR